MDILVLMPRIVLTLTDQLLEFLDRESEASGIDRSNLIRACLVNWRDHERERRLAEQQVAQSQLDPTRTRKASGTS